MGAVPYTPTSPNPILEFWRWRALLELKGLGLLDILEKDPDDFWFATWNGLVSLRRPVVAETPPHRGR